MQKSHDKKSWGPPEISVLLNARMATWDLFILKKKRHHTETKLLYKDYYFKFARYNAKVTTCLRKQWIAILNSLRN